MGAIAARMGRPLMPWQQHVADVAMELDADGRLAYDEVVLVVGRQGGKTDLKFDVAVHRSTAMAKTHGPQRTTFTMQTRTKARAKLEEYERKLQAAPRWFREISNPKRRPVLLTEWKSSFNNGAEHLQFGPASFIQIDAPSRTGSHGDSLDLGLIDEAFAHEDNRIEVGMEPAMATRRDAQLWVLSAAGDGRSKYLWRKVLAGRAACESGEHGRTAYFEWSAPDDADPGDPRTWRAACPALGFTISERFLRSAWEKALRSGQEGVDKFRRSYLSQWPDVPILDEGGARWVVLAEDAWGECLDPEDEPVGPLRYCLDVDQDAQGVEWASIGCSDGRHVELVTPPDVGPGTAWVVDACVAQREAVGELLVAPDGPAGRLIPALELAGVPVRKVRPAELAVASAGFRDAVAERKVRHIGQGRLTAAAAGVDRKDMGDGAWRFSRKRSVPDIGPLVAVAVAWWAASNDSPFGYYPAN